MMSDESGSPRYSVTLTDNRVLRFLFTEKAVQHVANAVTMAVFVYALYRTVTGPTGSDANFGTVAFFGLWWPVVMILSLVLLGRIWCYFCPMGAIVRSVQRFGLGRRFPTYRRRTWVVVGLPLSVLSLAAVTFVLARWPMYKVGVAYTTRQIPYYWLAFLGLAVSVSLVYRRQAFCRYVCPATGVMSVASKLSPVEVAQDAETGVECASAEFQGRYLSTDRRCVACMNCTTEQPDEDVELSLHWPGSKALTQRVTLVDEAVVALVIWAVFPIDHVLGDAVEGMAPVAGLPGYLPATVAYLVSITAAISMFAVANAAASTCADLDWTESFARFGLAYAPLGIMYTLGSHVIGGLLDDGGHTLNVFFNGLGVPLDLPAGASPAVVAAWEQFFVSGWLWLAVLWGAILAWRFAEDMASSRSQAVRAVLPHLALMASTMYVVTGILATHG